MSAPYHAGLEPRRSPLARRRDEQGTERIMRDPRWLGWDGMELHLRRLCKAFCGVIRVHESIFKDACFTALITTCLD